MHYIKFDFKPARTSNGWHDEHLDMYNLCYLLEGTDSCGLQSKNDRSYQVAYQNMEECESAWRRAAPNFEHFNRGKLAAGIWRVKRPEEIRSYYITVVLKQGYNDPEIISNLRSLFFDRSRSGIYKFNHDTYRVAYPTAYSCRDAWFFVSPLFEDWESGELARATKRRVRITLITKSQSINTISYGYPKAFFYKNAHLKMYYLVVVFKNGYMSPRGEDATRDSIQDFVYMTHARSRDGILFKGDGTWWIDYASEQDCVRGWSVAKAGCKTVAQDFEKAYVVDGSGKHLEHLWP
ncbi:hypothetical protein O9K51_09892 [Purpureocillium lavendulum]|uniref:Uncharacterized protein n=1 Tax=Purpureocillium lavendulum TaxID=1247861 RepID=A0AB34FD21_9HYPO|nr:hypothetical protein O9K51_09892 [Purpureocillium lavendulum]